MATRDEKAPYGAWLKFHATALGVPADVNPRTQEVWSETLYRWLDTFVEAGYSIAELTAATRALIGSSDPPHYTTDHLTALHDHIRGRRAVAYRTERDNKAEHFGTCQVCGSTGEVIVPHLACVVEGSWERAGKSKRFPTFAVTCSCGLGRWTRAKISRDVLTLEAYQERNPGWREQLEIRQREERDKALAAPPPNKKWAELVDRLMGHVRERGPVTDPELGF